MEKISKKQILPLTQAQRIWVLGINIAIAFILYFFATDSFFPNGSGASIWLLAIIAYWIASLVTAPFFVPPKDSLGIATSVILLMAPIDFSSVVNLKSALVFLNVVTIIISILVVILAITAIFRQNKGLDSLSQISFRISNMLGKGEFLLSPAIIISSIGFYQDKPDWMLGIILFWVLVVFIKPIEVLFQVWIYLKNFEKAKEENEYIGSVIKIDTPNLIYINLVNKKLDWNSGNLYATRLANGKIVNIIPLFSQVQDNDVIATGLFCEADDEVSISSGEIGNVYLNNACLLESICSKLSTEKKVKNIVGIITANSSISSIKFKTIGSHELEEGTVVFLVIREKKVYYQIVNANTGEEKIEQNYYGVHIVSATQLGVYGNSDGFKKFSWLPNMNQPVFLALSTDNNTQEIGDDEFFIGRIPNTSYNLPVVLSDLIEYHTAILGITGTGKTELVFNIIKNAIKREAKVFCVDLTGEYKKRLHDCNPELIDLDGSNKEAIEKLLFDVEFGVFGAKPERASLEKFLKTINPSIEKQVSSFLESPDRHLAIFELSEITNTRATLRTTELYLSAIMKWAQEHRRAQNILIVLEEAHTIIPEVYSSGFDSDTQWVVGRIGQIALQGRKYGVGLLIVSQRTALVSKTILSQCNTYFTYSLVDKTSLDYLNGVYSSEHVQLIPNLRYLEFLACGKAVKSEKPILVRRDYDPKIKEESEKLNEPKITK